MNGLALTESMEAHGGSDLSFLERMLFSRDLSFHLALFLEPTEVRILGLVSHATARVCHGNALWRKLFIRHVILHIERDEERTNFLKEMDDLAANRRYMDLFFEHSNCFDPEQLLSLPSRRGTPKVALFGIEMTPQTRVEDDQAKYVTSWVMRTRKPLRATLDAGKIAYFEVLVHEAVDGMVGIGLATEDYAKTGKFLGWNCQRGIAIGYHLDDGRLFTPVDSSWGGRGQNWGPLYEQDTVAVVGCGYVVGQQGGIFFTHSGKLLKRERSPVDPYRDCDIAFSWEVDGKRHRWANAPSDGASQREIREIFEANQIPDFFPAISMDMNYRCKVEIRFGSFLFSNWESIQLLVPHCTGEQEEQSQ